MGIFGVVLSLVLLMYLAYRGISVLILAPLLALLAVIFAGGLPIMATYTQVFMQSLGGYLIRFFPLFLLGAIFGKLMDDSGCARAIAHTIVGKLGKEQAILAIVLACGILTYGGVSLFVAAFAVFPIAAALFVEANLPKRLIPATIALGSFTFTMTALPGTPQIQNAIPTPYFGTTVWAAPGLGVIAAVIMFTFGVLWLKSRAAAAARRGEGYGEQDEFVTHDPQAEAEHHELPSFAVAITPIVLVIVSSLIMTYVWSPFGPAEYLAEEKYGETSIDNVQGLWTIILALALAIVVLIAMNYQRLVDLKKSVNDGTMGSLLPIFNTSSEVGYGSVIASLPAFLIIRDHVTGISENPLVSEAIAVNVLAGVTGSASGGMSIALEALGAQYLEMAEQVGISPELLHRVATLSSGGFDCLPHNGAVITLLAITGLTHVKSYFDIFVVAVAIPVLALITVIVLGSTFGAF
ncbi:MAG: GntP family permease [Geminicoccaceae bacterium]